MVHCRTMGYALTLYALRRSARTRALRRRAADAERDEKGQVIRRAEDTAPGQRLKLRLGEGSLTVEVKRRYKK